MRSLIFTVALVCFPTCLPISSATLAATRYVDSSVSASGDGTSWDTAFKTIQEGIDAASDGDTVIVAEGAYIENVKFNGKNIVLTSSDATNPTVVANTIIDGNQSGFVVTFAGTEDDTCILSGFTIQNGGVEGGGGILGRHTHATIQHNVITKNSGVYGGGVNWCDGVIQNNVISNNTASSGGGLALCKGLIQNNEIIGNFAPWEGGGLVWCEGTVQSNLILANSSTWGGGLSGCDGTIQWNTISGNSAEDHGGGLDSCRGTICSNVITGNSAVTGGGLYYCDGCVQNSTIVGNSAPVGSALAFCKGTIRNCIIWANSAAAAASSVYGCSAPSFSCVQEWPGGGRGNIAADPLFVNEAAGDYRLQWDSPCIDTGVSYYWSIWPQRDFSGNCRLAGRSVDMGCYEHPSSHDSDCDLLSDWDEAARGTDPFNQDTDGDSLRDGLEVLRGSDPHEMTSPQIINVPSQFPTIQASLCLAVRGDEIVVALGTYLENLQFCGVDVILRSSDLDSPETVAATIVDGSGAGPVVSFTGGETGACVLAGLTIRNGYGSFGGGVFGGREQKHTNATIRSNLITHSSADYGAGVALCDGAILGNSISSNCAAKDGGGLYGCDGDIQNNVICGNSCQTSGGGLARCNGRIEHNTIAQNSAVGEFGFGGGLADCRGIIQHNMISANSGIGGGGLRFCGSTIRNNVITRNSAVGGSGSGGGLLQCSGIIENNRMTENTALGYGGGLSDCQGTFQNNTVARNSANRGGGLHRFKGTIRNCIVWGNKATTTGTEQLSESSTPYFSCIENWTAGGDGNITKNALFVNPPADDYHLQGGSPCIDSGLDYYWFVWPQRDLDGNCRLVGNRVDMGCHEYGASPDSDGDLLSDDDETRAGTDPNLQDTDGDGLRDGLEALRRSNPDETTPPAVIRVPSDIETIQGALRLSVNGDEMVVAPGAYVENLHFCGTDIVLRSSDPGDPDIVSSTVIHGRSGPVVSFTGDESKECVLSGFTISGGAAQSGGGICGGTERHHTHAIIRNNLITANLAEEFGGAVAYCDGLIEKNTITLNSAKRYGGGLGSCSGIIENNKITSNTAGEPGGGLSGCSGIIRRNLIASNGARWDGGGLAYCDGVVENNLISANSANVGGGLGSCKGTIRNNTIIGNSASYEGGGVHSYDGFISNCIIWANTAPRDPQVGSSTEPTYSYIQDWTGGGEGNIADDPQFVDSDGPDNKLETYEDNDYRLSPGSPCIDAGYNAMDLAAMDIIGMHRIMFGGKRLTVDMGAYEFYINDLRPGPGPHQATFAWSSLADKTYSIFYSDDLPTWRLAIAAFPSSGNQTTSWLDDGSLTGIPPLLAPKRFYRLLENP